MTKRILVIACMLLMAAFSLMAQEQTTFTVGASLWNSQYDWVATDKDLDDVEIGSGNLIGPYLSINRGKVNFGISTLFGTFEMKDWDGAELKRTDLNFTLGYRIVSSSSINMNLFGGVKYLTFDITGKTTLWDYDEIYGWYSYEADVDMTQTGTFYGGGLSLMVPFGSSNLYGYGSLGYMTGNATVENNETDESSENDEPINLVPINIGIGYRFPSGLGINAGYRGDVFGSDESDYVDRLAGVIVTASYTF